MKRYQLVPSIAHYRLSHILAFSVSSHISITLSDRAGEREDIAIVNFYCKNSLVTHRRLRLPHTLSSSRKRERERAESVIGRVLYKQMRRRYVAIVVRSWSSIDKGLSDFEAISPNIYQQRIVPFQNYHTMVTKCDSQ